MNRKVSSLVAGLVIAVIIGAYVAGSQLSPRVLIVRNVGQNGGYENTVTYWVKRANMTDWDSLGTTGNLVTTQGAARTANYLFSVSGTTWGNTTLAGNTTSIIELSNSSSTPAVGWTYCANSAATAAAFDAVWDSGLARANGTITFLNATCYNVTNTFTATATDIAIQLSGLYWCFAESVACNATLFAANTFTSTTLYSGDQLKVQWLVNVLAA